MAIKVNVQEIIILLTEVGLLAPLGSVYWLVAISGQERDAGIQRHWSSPYIQVARDLLVFHLSRNFHDRGQA